MKEKAGEVFSLVRENPVLEGCTVSTGIMGDHGPFAGADVSLFSLGKGTDISAEIYSYPKLWLVLDGTLEPVTKSGPEGRMLPSGSLYRTPTDIPVGCRAGEDGAIYTEILVKEETKMDAELKAGEVFALRDLVPYSEGRIVNKDLLNDPHMKFVVMSFTKGTGLPEHAAPGEALIFALDGEGTIVYEGVPHTIHAGENFKFAPGGKHAVRADGNFKMALLLHLD